MLALPFFDCRNADEHERCALHAEALKQLTYTFLSFRFVGACALHDRERSGGALTLHTMDAAGGDDY